MDEQNIKGNKNINRQIRREREIEKIEKEREEGHIENMIQ